MNREIHVRFRESLRVESPGLLDLKLTDEGQFLVGFSRAALNIQRNGQVNAGERNERGQFLDKLKAARRIRAAYYRVAVSFNVVLLCTPSSDRF